MASLQLLSLLLHTMYLYHVMRNGPGSLVKKKTARDHTLSYDSSIAACSQNLIASATYSLAEV